MSHSDQISELAAALAKAQSAMQPAKLDSTNPHFRSKYASMTALWDAIRDPLAKNGLSVIQHIEDGTLITTLLHSSGQWWDSRMPINTAGTPQQIGSNLTYARRYSLAALVGGVSEEDDDAQATQGQPQPQQPPQRQASPTPSRAPQQPQAAPPQTETTPTPPSETIDPQAVTDAQRRMFHAIGKKVYGNDWPEMGKAMIRSMTGGSEHTSDMFKAQMTRLIDQLKAEEASMPIEDTDTLFGPPPMNYQ